MSEANPLALVSDLEERLRVEVGSLTGPGLRAAELAIEDASDLVLGAGDPEWTIDSVPRDVRRVVIGCALRAYRNPDSFQSENYGGDYSYQLPIDEATAYLTSAELEIVAAAYLRQTAGAGRRRGYGSIRTPSAFGRGGRVTGYDSPGVPVPEEW